MQVRGTVVLSTQEASVQRTAVQVRGTVVGLSGSRGTVVLSTQEASVQRTAVQVRGTVVGLSGSDTL